MMRRSSIALALLLVTLLAMDAGPAIAARITVCPHGCSYRQLAAAVAAARNGDSIRVAAGTYDGGFTIRQSVGIVGAGADVTTITGGGPVITVGTFGATHEPTVSIDAVTITGGVVRTSPQSTAFAGQAGVWALGGGVEIPPNADFTGGATVAITNSVVTGNSAAPSADSSGFAFAGGGGIDNWGALTLSDTAVSDNRVGGAIASHAFGAGVLNYSALTLNRSLVSGNHVSATGPNACEAGGGGIHSFGTLALAASAVRDNAVELSSQTNCGEAQGGGIFVNDGSGSIANSTVSGNRVSAVTLHGDATAFSGGIDDYNELTLRDSTVSHNRVRATTSAASATANPTAGGIGVVYPGEATISNTTVSANSVDATAPSGAAVAEGGGMQTTDTVLSDSLVRGNLLRARSTTGSASVHGAAVQHGNGRMTITGTAIRGNKAVAIGPGGEALGGGIWNGSFFPGPPGPQLALVATEVTDNGLVAGRDMTVHGGGLFTTSPVALADSTIAHNRPDNCFGPTC